MTIDPGKMSGQPCVRGLRMTVRRVLELIATYPDRSELFQEFPELTDKDLAQVLAYAGAQLPDRLRVGAVISVGPRSARFHRLPLG